MMFFKTDDCKYFTARHSVTLDSVTGTCGWWNLEVCPSFNVRCPRSSPRTMFWKKITDQVFMIVFQSFLGFLFLGDLFTVSSSCKKVVETSRKSIIYSWKPFWASLLKKLSALRCSFIFGRTNCSYYPFLYIHGRHSYFHGAHINICWEYLTDSAAVRIYSTSSNTPPFIYFFLS